MNVEAAVRVLLMNDPVVMGLAGQPGNKLRFWPGKLQPSAALPALVWTAVDTVYDRSHSRIRAEDTERLQIKTWHADLLVARAVAAEVRRVLEGFEGLAAGVSIKDARMANQMDQQDNESSDWSVIQDYLITYGD